MLRRLAFHAEHAIKGVIFDCHACGQCVLRKTAMICPMRCPKGLRNGPCGGILGGRCEVHPERKCIWVRIDLGRHGARLATPPILPATNARLHHTASIGNLLSGADAQARVPLAPLATAPDAASAPLVTASRLEAALKSGRFVVTTEIRTPRSPVLTRLEREGALLRDHFDAVNATAFRNGCPSLPSSTAAAALSRLGLETIAQATGRDHTRATFIGELMACQLAGVRNVLCLTGDYQSGERIARPVFDLDTSLMLYEARHLRDRSRIFSTGEEVANAPRQFLGCAINPLTTPVQVPVRRLLQKAAAGAEFVQSQVVTSAAQLAPFMAQYVAAGLDRRLHFIAGIPVVIGRKALERLPRVPGVLVDPAFAARLAAAQDLRQEGVAAAIDLVRAIAALPGVRGVHLMLFGLDHHALIDVRQGLRDLSPVVGLQSTVVPAAVS